MAEDGKSLNELVYQLRSIAMFLIAQGLRCAPTRIAITMLNPTTLIKMEDLFMSLSSVGTYVAKCQTSLETSVEGDC